MIDAGEDMPAMPDGKTTLGTAEAANAFKSVSSTI